MLVNVDHCYLETYNPGDPIVDENFRLIAVVTIHKEVVPEYTTLDSQH